MILLFEDSLSIPLTQNATWKLPIRGTFEIDKLRIRGSQIDPGHMTRSCTPEAVLALPHDINESPADL